MRPFFPGLIALTLAAGIAGCTDSATTSEPRGLSEDSPNFSTIGSTAPVHFISNGPMASAEWCSEEHGCSFLYVARGGTTSNPETFLSYSVLRCDPSPYCNVVEGGSGLIPNGDLSGTDKELHLSTDTNGNPDFQIWAGTGGLVSVDWRVNGIWHSRSTGTNHVEYGASACDTVCLPPMTQHNEGVWDGASATAGGAVASVTFPPSGGWSGTMIGMNHQVVIQIYR